MSSDYTTSWSDSHLRQLSVLTNHRIIYDRYDYRWEHFLDGEWEIHSIKFFTDYKQCYNWIRSTVYRWGKEIASRDALNASRQYYTNMFQDLEVTKQIYDISKEHNAKTFNKVKQIVELKPSISRDELSDLLDVSTRSINRYLEKLKQ